MEELERQLYEKTSNYDISVEIGTWSVKLRPMARPDPIGENKSKTERAGYIPAKMQIQNLLAAGKNLEEYRKKIYSNGEEKEEPEVDKTMRKDYTEMDAIEDAKKVSQRLKKQAETQEKARKDMEEAERIQAEKEREKLKSEKSGEDLGAPA